MAMALRALALVLLAGAMTASPGSAEQNAPAAPASAEPRTGLTCAWTMLRTTHAVGRRCGVTPIPGLQETLQHSISRMEDHVRQTAPEIRASMLERGRDIDSISEARLCASDAVQFYNELATGEPEALRDLTDMAIAEPGPPEWGECR